MVFSVGFIDFDSNYAIETPRFPPTSPNEVTYTVRCGILWPINYEESNTTKHVIVQKNFI